MDVDEQQSPKRAVVYEVRALTNRWTDPKAGPVISSHSSARSAWEAFKREPQAGTDGGRSSSGNYVPKAVVRVGEDGEESMVLPPPAGGGLLTWPYK